MKYITTPAVDPSALADRVARKRAKERAHLRAKLAKARLAKQQDATTGLNEALVAKTPKDAAIAAGQAPRATPAHEIRGPLRIETVHYTHPIKIEPAKVPTPKITKASPKPPTPTKKKGGRNGNPT